MNSPRNTPLKSEHAQLGAHFTDFAGWSMPLKYSSELAEHQAVRERAGLFDLSHMGEVRVVGPDAATFLNTALVGNLAKIRPGKAKYSMMCTETGGVIDDLISYRIEDNEYMVVPNAANREAVVAAFEELATGFDVEIWDETEGIALIAVQGPAAQHIVSSAVRADETLIVENTSYYAFDTVTIGGDEILLARTGYTGEDGFELYLPEDRAGALWRALLERGTDVGLTPCGLACRDSLRLEAGMPLYGNELSRQRTPFESGIPLVVLSKDEDFLGRQALEKAHESGTGKTSGQKLVGLKGLSRRAGRSGYEVTKDGKTIGAITSGQPSPTLKYPIAMAYVDVDYTEPGLTVEVDVRGTPQPYEVVSLPFYRRAAAAGSTAESPADNTAKTTAKSA